MAIINCPECGKEISDKSETCIYCGYPLKESMSEEVPKEKTSGRASVKSVLENLGKKKKKKGLFILLGAALVIVAIILISVINQNVLNEKEQYVYKVVAEYKEMLKDPDSMVLRGDILYVKNSSYDTYVAFSASGNNSYGAPVTSMPIFMNYSYLGDYDDDTDDLDDVWDAANLARGQLVVASWNLMAAAGGDLTNDDDYLEAELISGKKIAAKLKCKWKE